MKQLLMILVVVLIVGLYLNQAYSHIIKTIQGGGLVAPLPNEYVVGTSTDAVEKPMVYVALGDSLTVGVGVSKIEETFPYLFAKRIADVQNQAIKVINLGEPGARAADVLQTQIPKLAQFSPSVVTLVIGVNDIHFGGNLKDFEKNVGAVVSEIKKTGAKVFVATVPFVGDGEILWQPYQIYYQWQTGRYSEALKRAVGTENVTLVDLFGMTRTVDWRTNVYYSRDNFHLNATGYALWAKLFYDSSNR